MVKLLLSSQWLWQNYFRTILLLMRSQNPQELHYFLVISFFNDLNAKILLLLCINESVFLKIFKLIIVVLYRQTIFSRRIFIFLLVSWICNSTYQLCPEKKKIIIQQSPRNISELSINIMTPNRIGGGNKMGLCSGMTAFKCNKSFDGNEI